MNAADLPSWLPLWWLESLTWIVIVFFVAALTEMIFPPFPGDTVFFVGLVMVQSVHSSVTAALIATLLGGLAGFGILYWLGRYRGRRLFKEEKTGLFAVSSLERVEGWFRRWGGLVILFGRFLSGVRSVVPLAAGVGNQGVASTFVFGALSIVLFNGLLATAALLLHQSWSTVSRFWNMYSAAIWGIVIVASLLIATRALLKRRRAEN